MLQLTKGFSSIIAVPIIPQNTLFQTEPGLTSQVPKAGRRMKRGQSSGQLLNSPVGPLHGHPLKQQQPPDRARQWARRSPDSSTEWLRHPRAGLRELVPERPCKNQARGPTLCAQGTHCGWSKGLSVDPELLGNQTPCQPCSTELRNITTRLYVPRETEGYK